MYWKKRALLMSLGLWCLMAVLPFASRTHYVPLPQWWGEIESVWLALGLVLLGFLAHDGEERLPRVSVWCLVLAGLWAVQPWVVSVLFPGLNDVTALAWGVLALLALGTITLREELGDELLTVWLARALMAGALVQSLIGFAQLTGIAMHTDGLIFYDVDHPTTNVFGHIGQRNQFSHYLMWGMVASVYLQSVNRLRLRFFALWVSWLALLLAFAGSRAILLYIVATTVVSIVWHRRMRVVASRRLVRGMLVASAVVVVVQLLLPVINQLVSLLWHPDTVLASGVERLAVNDDDMASRRIAEMHKAWLVFRSHPWWGIGWSQFAAQSVELQMLPLFAKTGLNSGLFTNAHNLVLQLLAEMGGVMTAVILLGFVWVILPFFTARAESEGFLPVACLTVSFLHSMLEYPLWYFYFLAMVIIFAALAPHRGYRLSRWMRAPFAVGWGALAVVSVFSLMHYRELVSLYNPSGDGTTDAKRQQQLVLIIQQQPLYAFHALYTLDNYLTTSAEGFVNQRRWIEMLAAIRPYPDVLLKKAQLEALLGEPVSAAKTIRTALASFPTYASVFLGELAQGPVVWRPLEDIVRQAEQELPKKYRRADSS